MDRTSKVRWAILSCALVATVAAIFYPLDPDDGGGLASADRPARSAMARSAMSIGAGSIASPAQDYADPFAPRGWKAPPRPVEQAPVTIAAVAPEMIGPPAPPPPVKPPPLPYRFMGKLNDGGDQVIYLGRGDQVVLARSGETLDGTYKILSVNAQRIEFEHVPTGEKQTLNLPASES